MQQAVPEHLAVTTSQAVKMFLAFACAYFLSALVRGVTATLAPTFSTELGLSAADLGLLAGSYFFGFALAQLPLGSALDRLGPRRVLLVLMSGAVLGCLAFAAARNFIGLAWARGLIGVGVSACLMAPMTAYCQRFSPQGQMRANSWMLTVGSLGMAMSTMPVHWVLPWVGWRWLFVAIACGVLLAMVAIYFWVPADASVPQIQHERGSGKGYGTVLRHPTFVRFAPMGFIHYGGLVAVQSLWAGPWLVHVGGHTQGQAAQGLLAINIALLVSFLAWGLVVPRLYAQGWTAQKLIAYVAPVSLVALGLIAWMGTAAGTGMWVVFCVSCSVMALSQPAVAQAFPPALAGRALTAYNLLVFMGVFVVQWTVGLAIDFLQMRGWSEVQAYQGAFALLAVGCMVSYVWFLSRDDNRPMSGNSV